MYLFCSKPIFSDNATFRPLAHGHSPALVNATPFSESMQLKTSFPPDRSILCPIFWVLLRGHQPFGCSPDLLVADEIVNTPEDDQNVVTNQGTVLFRSAFFKAQHEPLQECVTLWLAHNADLPKRLQAMTGGHKVLILSDSQQGCNVL